jgi:hypothetical protein
MVISAAKSTSRIEYAAHNAHVAVHHQCFTMPVLERPAPMSMKVTSYTALLVEIVVLGTPVKGAGDVDRECEEARSTFELHQP